MKRYYIILALIFAFILTSCSTDGKFKNLERQYPPLIGTQLQEAIESTQFTIRVERISGTRGSNAYLRPTNNYIIVNQGIARINLAYIGRSYDMRGISGINMSGRVVEYILGKDRKGNWDLRMKVKQNNDIFTLNITVYSNGSCNVNLTNARIDLVRYKGQFTGI